MPRSEVLLSMRAVVREGLPDARVQSHTRLPSEQQSRRPIRGVVVTDVDRLEIGGERDELDRARAVATDNELCQLPERDWLAHRRC